MKLWTRQRFKEKKFIFDHFQTQNTQSRCILTPGSVQQRQTASEEGHKAKTSAPPHRAGGPALPRAPLPFSYGKYHEEPWSLNILYSVHSVMLIMRKKMAASPPPAPPSPTCQGRDYGGTQLFTGSNSATNARIKYKKSTNETTCQRLNWAFSYFIIDEKNGRNWDLLWSFPEIEVNVADTNDTYRKSFQEQINKHLYLWCKFTFECFIMEWKDCVLPALLAHIAFFYSYWQLYCELMSLRVSSDLRLMNPFDAVQKNVSATFLVQHRKGENSKIIQEKKCLE